MIVKIDRTFEKDLAGIQSKKLLLQISNMIEDVGEALNIEEIKNIKKIKGYKEHYRIRIGNYRAGLIVKNNTVEFIRFLHRKDIYKRFP